MRRCWWAVILMVMLEVVMVDMVMLVMLDMVGFGDVDGRWGG